MNTALAADWSNAVLTTDYLHYGMVKQSVMTAQAVVDMLNTCGWKVTGFNNKRQWLSRKTGQMETIPFANLSIQKNDRSQTFFMNRGRDGLYTIKEALGKAAATGAVQPPANASVSQGDSSLDARMSKIEQVLLILAERK